MNLKDYIKLVMKKEGLTWQQARKRVNEQMRRGELPDDVDAKSFGGIDEEKELKAKKLDSVLAMMEGENDDDEDIDGP